MYLEREVCSRQDWGLRHLNVMRERATNDSDFINILHKSDHEMYFVKITCFGKADPRGTVLK